MSSTLQANPTDTKSKTEHIHEPIFRIAFVLIIIWSLLILYSYFSNASNLRTEIIKLAIAEAKANWNKDQAFRGWATKHGGLYVSPDARTPPNPYLAHIKDRDITTTDGRNLTLMNPAYMLRQMIDEYEKSYGIKGSITGEILLNPINAPDEWQLAALKKFKQGATEIIDQTNIKGAPYVRYMKPMYMKKGCEKCHGHLGFKEGDLRGGVSVSIPLSKYFTEEKNTLNQFMISHSAVWGFGFLGIFSFVLSARKREKSRQLVQDKLNQQQDILEDRVKERTKELMNAKLIADKASLAKTEFLSRMSHELRTPLNAILGFAQILEKDFEQEQNNHSEDVGEILHAGNHLLELINEVLDLSYIESGKYKLNIEQVKIHELIDDCIPIVRAEADERNISIVSKFSHCQCQIYVDKKRLKQILINLLSNAIKYNKERGEVVISCMKANENKTRIALRILAKALVKTILIFSLSHLSDWANLMLRLKVRALV